jgi:glycerate kinase
MKHWKMQRGIDILIDLYDLRPIMKSASLIITGEGCIDRQTLCGKVPYSIGLMAKEMGVPCIALCGRMNDNIDTAEVPWTKIIQVSPPDQSLSESMRPDVARENIRKAISSASL